MTLKSSASLAVIALAGLVAAAAIWWSISRPIPAGIRHIHSSTAIPPDQAPEDPGANNFFHASTMTPSRYHAKSQSTDPQALGGFGKSDNAQKRILSRYTTPAMSLVAQPSVVMLSGDQPGMRVSLVNATHDLLAFTAFDSCLAMVQEAQDSKGRWTPIEYLPTITCGNSYHRVFLAPDHFWEFHAPRYQGSITTTLRFALTLADGSQLYSNASAGSVNPGQFTLKTLPKIAGDQDPRR